MENPKDPLELVWGSRASPALGPSACSGASLPEEGSGGREPRKLFHKFFQIPAAFIRTQPWPCGAGRGARGWRSVPSQGPFTPSKGIHTPAVRAPPAASSGGGRGAVHGGRPAAPALHGVLSGAGSGAEAPGPGPLPLRGASRAARERPVLWTIPEAGLGGQGPSKGPASVFLSKVQK